MRVGAIIVGLVCLCTVALIVACLDTETKMSSRAANKAEAYKRDIRAEINDLGEHPWAGDFYEGDGLGANISLMLAPKAGFVYEWRGCLGLYDRNYGSVSFKNDRIQLSLIFPNGHQELKGVSTEFVPVSWGPRLYLIPADDIVGFCNSVNAGGEPRDSAYGSHLLRCSDENKPVDGFPKIPSEFEPYLLKEPIFAEIVATSAPQTRPSVADWRFRDTPVKIEGGSDIGLRCGMELFVVLPKNVHESVKITSVGENVAEGTMTEFGEEGSGPQVGWHLSTRPHWRPLTKNQQINDAPSNE